MRQLTQEEIERRYSLAERSSAVRTCIHAVGYLAKQPQLLNELNAIEVLMDGVQNAIDHRATGFEFRTLRHTRLAKHDPQHHPKVADQFRRCQTCGAIQPRLFSNCPHVEEPKR